MFTGTREYRDLKSRVINLEREVAKLIYPEQRKLTIKVPVVDADGEYVRDYRVGSYFSLSAHLPLKKKEITIEQAIAALEEMCGVEITYQEIPKKSGVVIYEKG